MMKHAIFGSVCGLVVIFAQGAFAADWYTGTPAPAGQSLAATNWGATIDAALSVSTKDTLHLAMIGTIAPFTKMEESGIRLRLGGLIGSYAYISSTAGVGRVKGKQEDGSFMAGYEWVTKSVTAAAYVGAEIRNDKLSTVDPSNKAIGTTVGFKGEVQAYARPTTYTMLFGQFVYSTAHSSYYGRLKAGLKVFDQVYVGPEMLLLGDNIFSQWRVGAHLTGISVGALEFGISGGYLQDKSRGSGLYGIVDARVSF